MTASPNTTVPDADRPAGQEAQLLTELAAGDATALEHWFCRHQPGLYAFIYYRVGRDADLASDAAQATFTLALERLDDFDPGRGDMATWLRTLARNVIRSLLTQHGRAVPLAAILDGRHQTHEALRQIDSQPLPETVLERQETRELVAMTLAHLRPQYQEVLEARYLRDQPLEAIAMGRNTTLDSVKSMLRRARAAFRECFLALAGNDVSDVEVSDV